jgi:hypothetical protein
MMKASEVPRAVTAAVATAAALGLRVNHAIVLHDSNRLTLRLLPCDALARVAPGAHQAARFEIELAQRLAGTESPVAALEPRAVPSTAVGHARDAHPAPPAMPQAPAAHPAPGDARTCLPVPRAPEWLIRPPLLAAAHVRSRAPIRRSAQRKSGAYSRSVIES